MVVGTMAISVAAFDDDDEINEDYAKAVAILAANKVIEGYENKFDPKRTLTRAEGVAIVVRALLGRTTANKLNASAVAFNDVTEAWAKGVVAYAADQKMVDGYGNGKFGPDDALTGYAYAKFLLTAMGVEGEFTGANWENNVMLAAIDAGLTVTKDFDYSKAITREEAAQMTLQAVEADRLTAETGKYMVVDDNGDVIEKGFNSYYEAWNVANTLSTTTTTTYKAKAETALVGKIFAGVSYTEADTTDAFGHTSTTYLVSKKPVYKDAITADDAVEIYLEPVTGGKIYSDLGLTINQARNATYNVYLNGYKVTDLVSTGIISSGNRTVVNAGAYGTSVEIYDKTVNSSYPIYDIVVVQTFPGVIKSFTAATKNANGQVTADAYITVTVLGTDKTFATDDFSKADVGSVVLVNASVAYDYDNNKATSGTKAEYNTAKADPDNWVIESVAIADSITGNVASTRTANGVKSYSIGGKSYKLAENATAAANALVASTAENKIYLDANGYIIDAVGVKDDTNYAVVVDYGSENTGVMHSGSNAVYYATLLYTDGTKETVKVAPSCLTGDNSAAKIATLSGLSNSIVSYAPATGTEAGTIKLSTAAGTGSAFDTATVAVTKNSATIDTDIFANSKTVYIVERINSTTKAVSYDRYVGVAAVPTLQSANVKVVKSASNNYASFVYVVNGKNATSSTTVSDIVFVYSDSIVEDTAIVNGNSVTTYTYKAIVNGKADTLTSAVAQIADNKNAFVNGYSTGSYGQITLGTALTTNGYAQISGTGISTISNSVVTVAGTKYVVNDSTLVFKLGADGFEAVALEDVTASTTANVYGYTKDNVVAVLVIA